MDGHDRDQQLEQRTGLQVLSPDACIDLLQRGPIGRVVFVDDEGQPIALPVNYRWYDGAVVFRTIEGQKLMAAVVNRRVSFEVDHWDAAERTGASVLVKGKAARVEDWAECEQLEQIGLVPWAKDSWRPYWIRIEPVEITGRGIGWPDAR